VSAASLDVQSIAAEVRAAVARVPHSATYDLGECRFHLRGGEDVHRREIEEFLPWKAAARPPRRTYELVVVCDTRLRDMLSQACLAAREDEFRAFAGERCWAATRGEPRLYCSVDDELRPEVIVRDRGAWVIVLPPGEPRFARSPLRALRELYIRDAEEHALMVHAAAFVRRRGARLIVGGKGAGKTTLLFSCLGDSAFLANDRVVVTPDLHVLPFPRPCRVGLGTAYAIPSLRAVLGDLASVRREQDPVLLRDGIAFGSEIKLELSPADVVRTLGVEHATAAPLAQILLPRIEIGSEAVHLARVSASELRSELEAEALVPADETTWRKPWLTTRSEDFTAMRLRAADCMARIAERVPALRVGFGTNTPIEIVRRTVLDALEDV
jgi:hypothetical protein